VAGTQGRPVLIVFYDLGAAGSAEILSAARGGYEVVFACDRTSPYVAQRFDALSRYATVMDVTGQAPAAVATALAARGPSGAVTFSESRLGFTAEVALAAGLPFHHPDVVAVLTDKHAQRAALRAAGVDGTRCRVVRHGAELAGALAEVGLPAVVKPRRGGAASRDTYLVHDAAQATDLLTDLLDGGLDGGLDGELDGELVVEEYLAGDPGAAGEFWGDRVSVESLVVDGRVHPVGVTGKFALAPPLRETGQFAPCTLAPEAAAEAERLAERAVLALGVRHGATHTELKLTAAGPRVIEVNGRLGGNLGDLLRRGAGFDILRATMDVAAGATPRLPSPRGRRTLAYQRYLAPPMRQATLVTAGELDRLRRLPGVRRVEEHARPGAALDWRRGTEECLAVVYGEARNHDELRATVEAIDAAFQPVYA